MFVIKRFRYVIALLIFNSTLACYIGRINLSTAIVEMAKKTTMNRTDIDNWPRDVCYDTNEPFPINNSSLSTATTIKPATIVSDGSAPRFDWSEKTQGILLGAFFWGYFLMMVPGGRIAETHGPRLLLTFGMVMTGLINLLTPFMAPLFYVFVASRVVLGLSQAIVFPGCYALVSNWIPEHERSTVLALTSVGGSIGTIITSSMSGYLCKHGFAGGWPSVFYVTGIICIVMGIISYLMVTNHPGNHPMISSDELLYIKENMPKSQTVKSDTRFPWKAVLTSVPVIAEICAKLCMTWVYSFVILKAPSYMEKVLRMPLERNGMFSSLFFVATSISLLLSGIIADWMIQRKVFKSKTTVRKIFEGISVFGTGLSLAFIPLADCNETFFLLIMIISQITFGMQAGGELPLPSDMSNEYSATIFAINNMCGMSMAFVGPFITGMILDMEPTMPKQQWSYIIYFTVAFNMVGGLIFSIFASAELQNWTRSKS